MDKTPSVTNSIMQQTFTAQENKSPMAPIQHQKQGFFQVSPADNTYTANTYNANGQLPRVQTTANGNTEFNQTF